MPRAGDIRIAITPARTIWMLTAIGFMYRVMATFGSLIRKPHGPPIKREDGFGSHITVGPGYLTNRGVGPLITTAGGSITAAAGAGGLDRFTCIIVRCGRPRLFSLSALDTTPASALVPLDGSRWVRMTRFIPGTDAASIA